MELKLVEQLLEKYGQGATTLAEEKQLKIYFSSKEVAPHLAKYQTLFGYFETQKELQFKPKRSLQPRKQSTVKWMGIAAGFVVLFGTATFCFYPFTPKHNDLGTFDTPEEAFLATQNTLLMISKEVNNGFETVAYLDEYNKSTRIIFK